MKLPILFCVVTLGVLGSMALMSLNSGSKGVGESVPAQPILETSLDASSSAIILPKEATRQDEMATTGSQVALLQLEANETPVTDYPQEIMVKCEEEELRSQLNGILLEHNFDVSHFELASDRISIVSRGEADLPYRIQGDEICILRLEYVQATTSIQVRGPESSALMNALDNTYKTTVIGEYTFEPIFADGPLTSSIDYPIAGSEGTMQILRVSSQARIVPISFPESYTCPCSEKVNITLTAPFTLDP